MEASHNPGEPDPGQSGDLGQPQPGSTDEVAGSQDQPTQDSGLRTPQPDQPVPSEAERQDASPDAAQAAQPVQEPSPSEYRPRRLPLENAGRDQVADEARRQDELQAQRDEHNARTGGGQVPDVEPQASQPADGSG